MFYKARHCIDAVAEAARDVSGRGADAMRGVLAARSAPRQPVHLDRAWRDRRATRRAGIGRMRGVLCRAGRR